MFNFDTMKRISFAKVRKSLAPSVFYKNKRNASIVSILAFQYGRSDGIRTHGLLVPNQARYQLRYARMYLVIIPTVAGFVKNGGTKVVDKIHAQGYNEPKWR